MVNYELDWTPDVLASAEEHAAACGSCREVLALDRLSASLVRAYASQACERVEPSPFWMTRLKARIQEMKEQGVSSWEAAICGLRGLVTAMGALAIVLFALSFPWQPIERNETVNALSRFDRENEEAVPPGAVEELIGGAPEANQHKTTNLYE